MVHQKRTQKRARSRSVVPVGTVTGLPGPAADSLRQFAADARGAFSDNTVKAWKQDGMVWSAWCDGHGLPTLTDDPRQVVRFVDDMAATRKPATISRYCSSIARLHTAAGMADPTDDPVVSLAKRRQRREVGSRQRQARGLTEQDARLIIRLTPTGTMGLRDLALLLTARDMLARRSELVALDVADLDLEAGTATIARSKTDQEGEGATAHIGPRTCDYLWQWMEAAGIVEGAVFRPLSKGGRVRGDRLNAADVARIFKRLAARAGLDAAAFSGHSARVGMTQDLTADGADLAGIMQAGRWKTARQPARYGEKVAAGKNAVARFYERNGTG